MEVLAAKLTALFILFLTAIIFGLLPIRLVGEVGRRLKAPKTSKFQSCGLLLVDCLNCFAGGVFFSTSLLHLLPDVRRGIESAMDSLNRTPSEFPFAEFLASVGVFVVVILEQSMTACSHHGGSGPKKKPHSEEDENVELLDFDIKTEDDRDQEGHAAAHRSPDRPPMRDIARRPPPPSPVRRSLVLLLALSTHTVFEGLALGLQAATTDVWTLCSAILLHKVVMSFVAGLRFAESFPSAVVSRAVCCVVAFAFMTPVGIATGMVVTETGYRGVSTKIAAVVLQGLATGTFIYVTFFEILVEQMAKRPNLLKVMAVLLGYSSIAALKIFVSESK